MKAAYIRSFGAPEVLEFGEYPDPRPNAGEVVVAIAAASVNAADWQVRAGAYDGEIVFPYVLGRDFSGTVQSIGAEVTDWEVGEDVFGVCNVGQEGAYAERIAVQAAIIAPKPIDLPHRHAAAMALAGITALSAIEDTLELRSGETILIQGGAGGVASFAVQVAKDIGARVVTTARSENHGYLRELGADEIIDYTTADFTTAIRDCDAVFDTVGGDVAHRSFAVLKAGGRAAFIASGPRPPQPERQDVASLRPTVKRSRGALDRVLELWKRGAVRPPEIVSYGLSSAADAHRLSQSRHFRGKIVLDIQ